MLGLVTVTIKFNFKLDWSIKGPSPHLSINRNICMQERFEKTDSNSNYITGLCLCAASLLAACSVTREESFSIVYCLPLSSAQSSHNCRL